MRLSLRHTKVDAHDDSLWAAAWTAGPDLLVRPSPFFSHRCHDRRRPAAGSCYAVTICGGALLTLHPRLGYGWLCIATDEKRWC
jgi:hypothetical protein